MNAFLHAYTCAYVEGEMVQYHKKLLLNPLSPADFISDTNLRCSPHRGEHGTRAEIKRKVDK